MPMDFTRPLAFTITPKRGPVSQLETLRDASHALTIYLPLELRRRPHWLRAGRAVLNAVRAEAPSEPLILDATEALVDALETEGWMSSRVRYPADLGPRREIADPRPRGRSVRGQVSE
jgi:hypothetical protein